MNQSFVINIQRCCIHDGPGIRTTVFFKGCPLNCIWCHNPESQSYTREILYNKEKCSKCLKCMSKCNNNAIYFVDNKIYTKSDRCELCENCIDVCTSNAREIVGSSYEVKDIINELSKDMIFYEESGGGVTLSGGEVMIQNIDYIVNIIRNLKNKGISIAIDTCGYAKWENFEKVLPYVDMFLYDIKLIDDKKHIKFTGKSNKLILNNVRALSERGANINIRVPLIEGVNTDLDEIHNIITFLKTINISMVNLLPYHNIGVHKYSKLNKKYSEKLLKRPKDDKLEEIKALFVENNFNTKIGG